MLTIPVNQSEQTSSTGFNFQESKRTQAEALRPLAPSVSDSNSAFLMERSKSNLITRTTAVWQPHSVHRISDEDAREIAENITGFLVSYWNGKLLRMKTRPAKPRILLRKIRLSPAP